MAPKILIVKTTSMGDVIHALPAVNDIRRAMPKAQIDWLVEGSFSDIPAMSGAVDHVFKVAVRRWRKSLFAKETRQEIAAVKKALYAQKYDCVIDLQGLVKSAWLARWANAPICGYDSRSIKEPIASWFYKSKFSISKSRSAIDRCRALCAKALGYEYDGKQIDFGLSFKTGVNARQPYATFLVNTSRETKLWPEEKWIALGRCLAQQGLGVRFLWAAPDEYERVQRLAQGIGEAAFVHPRLSIAECGEILAGSTLVVGVDTGLTHLAAATDRPTVGLFLDYPIELVGLTGKCVRSLGGVDANPSVDEVLTAIKEVQS
ncbi:MAG: lipopolysaccharide heptosyltransferase I [Burkholderiaceae bacterium]|nr:lipopolysaccharide heptosyltransferase I [Burkholderiaceae bacterium]